MHILVAAIVMLCGIWSIWEALRIDVREFPKRGKGFLWFGWLVVPAVLCWIIWSEQASFGTTLMMVAAAGLCLAIVAAIIFQIRYLRWSRHRPSA